MTFDINEYWGVTVSNANLIGPNTWQAIAWVFRRDNYQKIEPPHIATESTRDLADNEALLEAKKFILTLDRPHNWKNNG